MSRCWVLERGTGDRCVLEQDHLGQQHMSGYHTFTEIMSAEDTARLIGTDYDTLQAECQRLRAERDVALQEHEPRLVKLETVLTELREVLRLLTERGQLLITDIVRLRRERSALLAEVWALLKWAREQDETALDQRLDALRAVCTGIATS